MEITIKEANGVQIVAVNGKIDTNTAPEVELAFIKLLEAGQFNLLADFENLSFISSAGLRVLLATAKKAKLQSGGLKVCCLNATVQEVFDISGFASILQVFATQEEALNG
ncbi:MAG: anti-sigma B factor antagonist [Marinobacter psychrophilus]|jgi:anti-sigma B factor antagonist